MKFLKLDSEHAMFLLRVTIGILFVVYGISKFQRGMENIEIRFSDLGIPLPLITAWLVSIIELFGGLALILGLRARLFASLLAVIIVGTLFTAKLGAPFMGEWDLNLVVLVSLIVILIQGSGSLSMSKRSNEGRI